MTPATGLGWKVTWNVFIRSLLTTLYGVKPEPKVNQARVLNLQRAPSGQYVAAAAWYCWYWHWTKWLCDTKWLLVQQSKESCHFLYCYEKQSSHFASSVIQKKSACGLIQTTLDDFKQMSWHSALHVSCLTAASSLRPSKPIKYVNWNGKTSKSGETEWSENSSVSTPIISHRLRLLLASSIYCSLKGPNRLKWSWQHLCPIGMCFLAPPLWL